MGEQKISKTSRKRSTKKRILVTAGAIVSVIIATIAIILGFMNNDVEKKVKTKKIYDSELARAMTYDQFVEGDENVEGTDNIKFSAFFLRDLDGDGYAEKIKGTCKQVGKDDTLYMEINVQTEGILKNAKIEINGQNFYLATASPKDNELKGNYIGINTKQIEFNDLNNGTQKLLAGIVRSGDYTYSSSKMNAIGKNLNNLSRNDNKIILTGTYVNGEGNEIEIRKEIDLAVDWYGETRAELYTYSNSSSRTYYDIDSRIDEENQKINLTATIKADETKNELNISKNYVTGTIPELNGCAPIEVTSNLSDLEFNYNAETREFTIERIAEVSSENMITKSIAKSNTYTLNISYPLEAYRLLNTESVQIKIPVSTYYEGLNNPNSEFKNPYKSNIADKTLIYYFRGKIEESVKYTSVGISVGKYIPSSSYRYIISKQKPLKIYNGISSEEKDDNYTVRWSVSKGTTEVNNGLIMKETGSDKFIKTDSTTESMENLSTNVGIGFSYVDSFLNEDGFIKVYDDSTDELLVTFTKEDWGKYTQNNPYRYSLPVKNIRVETSQTKDKADFYVYNIKKLDDEYITENYTKEEFDNLQYIESNLSVTAGEKTLGSVKHSAYYEAPYSIASISLSNSTLSTQVTEKNEKITIHTSCDSSANQVAWKNGSFLVKLPNGILTTEINSVEIDNRNVNVTSSEYIENENGKFIKINTENTVAQTYNIVIDVNITPDPRIATINTSVELWATNEEAEDYYYDASDIYDVNNNLNIDEKVHKSSIPISLVAPNSLLTNQTASNYDEKGTTVVSPQIADFRPPMARVDQETEEKTVKIGVQLKNNYPSAISETVILGKIPFEGNTYVISRDNLNSSFTTKMVEGGLEVPAELQGKVQVYYSENENPDRDLTKEENGWKLAENIENWDNVKTFLVDFVDTEIPAGKEYVFYYTVKVPNGIEYDRVSYSHHGIYFALNTEQGKYRTKTEPNKIGIRIAEKYNLEIQKYQKGKDVLVPGATYKVTEESAEIESAEEVSKTIVTDESGLVRLNNLYAERVYRIEELKVPDDYELNSEVVRFIGHVEEDGSLRIETLEGTTREEVYTEKVENEEYKVVLKLEDEAKARLKVIKTEQGTENLLIGVRYKLSGDSLPESGKTLTTNINGEINFKGLKIGTIYTLEEIKADGYYLARSIKFKILNNEGTYSVEITEGAIKENIISEENNLPILTLKLEDEKKPTYNLELTKIKKVTQVSEGESPEETTYLSGAKFRLYKGTKEIGDFITDENGKLVINNLYQYVEEKASQEDGEYVLKEILAPEGYSKVKDIKFKVENSDGNLNFIEELTDGQTAKQYTIDGTTVKIVVEDSPSFKLIKKDGETGEVLANTKFAIYNVDDGEVPARNSKGEIVGTKETIDGREYNVVVTNSVGEITLDLPEGLYKAVEVEADEKYDISDSVYYFGIGTSREGKKALQAEWGKGLGGTENDYIESVSQTADGGYIVGGDFYSESIDLGNGVVLNHSGNTSLPDGMIIKYDSEGHVEWGKAIGGSSSDQVNSVIETADGGYIVGGYFYSESIDLGNGIVLNNNGSSSNDGMIIKYDSEGNVEWGKAIGGSSNCSNFDTVNSVVETSDGGYIAGGRFYSDSIDLGNGIVLNNNGSYDGMIIKLDSEGNVEWGKAIGGSNSDDIGLVIETSDGGYVVGGDFESSSIDLGNGVVLKNHSYTNDGMIIKYDSEGNAEWGKAIGGNLEDYINSVIETADGGYIVEGSFDSDSIDLENGIVLNNIGNNGYSNGMIIKLDSEGNVKWGKVIGGSGYSSAGINSVVETTDGGYIVGGYFTSDSIDLGNGVVLNGSNDGMIIKYDSEGNVEWGKAIGERINSVIETTDGGYIAGGYFYSRIYLRNGEVLNNNGFSDGMIIKLKDEEVPDAVIKQGKVIGCSGADYIISAIKTTDEGYVIVGSFNGSIYLKNGEVLNSNGGNDGMIIKYDSEGNAEWGKVIGGSNQIISVTETVDGGYIVGGHFYSSSIDLGDGVVLYNSDPTVFIDGVSCSDGMIIKYDSEGNVEWGKAVGGGSESDYIESVIETADGGCVVVGRFNSDSIDLGNGIVLNNKGSKNVIIKYNSKGKVEWGKVIGVYGDRITSVIETEDGGYVVGGYFDSDSIDLGNGIVLNNNYISEVSSDDGMIIKFDSEGNAEWGKVIGGSSNFDSVNSVVETSDGGYVVGGNFDSDSIDLGNGIVLNNNYTGEDTSSDGMIIKFDSEGNAEWGKVIGGDEYDSIGSVTGTADGGYVIMGGSENSRIDLGNGVVLNGYDNMIIKLDSEGNAEWGKPIAIARGNDFFPTFEISSINETKDGGFIVCGTFDGWIDLENGMTLNSKDEYDETGMIIKFDSEGNTEWGKAIGNGLCGVYLITELVNGGYLVGGSFEGSIDVENGELLSIDGSYDGIILKITETMEAPDVQEITAENKRKDFKITTDVKEIDNIKGGNISGEDESAYEVVKYGDTSIKEIIMIPDENYEIIGITVNGEEYQFEANEDGSYVMPQFENVTEDKHIVVTYSLKDNKITINKVDSITKESLTGAKFKLDQMEERSNPENVIGDLTDNGQEYDEIDLTKEVKDVLGLLTANGKEYSTADIEKEVTGVIGELTNNGTYYFIEQDGKYVPTNSKTYQVANGGTTGKHNTTANSYIPIDLSSKTGKFAVVINANISSESNYDYGYATITETTSAPTYSNSTGRFIYMSGTVSAKDYTSIILEGGKTYYLHLGYRKDSSGDTGTDQIEFNSIKVYEATSITYNFIENAGKYESNNQGKGNTTANSYIPIDLTSKTGKFEVIVNANISSQSSNDYGYATITETTSAPTYSNSTGRFVYISGTQSAKDYTSMVLEGGKKYYLHLGYYKNANTDTGDDKFTVNSVKVCENKVVTYNFIENEGKYESNNQGKDNTTANSYIPIDLTSCTGKYNLVVNAEISSESSDYGYAVVTENTTRPAYYSGTGQVIYISGIQSAKDYSVVLQGGKMYYLHLGYYKNSSTSQGDDKFTINSVNVTLNDSELYHTEVEVDSEGKAITQIPFGKYKITEIQAPDGYWKNEEPTIIEFRADENHEFTIENEKKAKVIVHHYIKGTTTKVAEDDEIIGKINDEYATNPKMDLPRYELEKDEVGEYILPENATGTYTYENQEVIYYYNEKEIPLVVHHYIEGTETKVPLKDGTVAEDVTSSAPEGTAYITEEISNELLDDEYQLIEKPENAEGIYASEEVIVTYYYNRIYRNLNITKIDEKTGEPVPGVKFGITKGTKETLNEFGELVEESDIYHEEEIVQTGNYITDTVVGNYESEGTFYFEEKDGVYVSNNKGLHGSRAASKVLVDLTDYEGNYAVNVNAEISSEENIDYGIIRLEEENTYNYEILAKDSGEIPATDYTKLVQGGKRYYLHIEYKKDSIKNRGKDQFKINSINVYSATSVGRENKYFFETINGKYISNNEGKKRYNSKI